MTAPKIEIDEHLRPYEISESDLTFGKSLGCGACGQVFAGRFKDENCAIKVFTPFSDEYSVTCFLREISTALTASHPAILKLIGFVPSVERPIVVSEFMCQGTLASVRKERIPKRRWAMPFSDIRLAQALYGVAAGMEFLHARNIIHRDLKPENVFLGKKGAPCIGDFGASRFLESSKGGVKCTGGVGTPLYMAPELIEGQDSYTNKIDVYAFGVMVVIMFSYSEPLVLETGLKVTNEFFCAFNDAILAGNRLARPKDIPDCYWELATKCWDQKPENRPAFSEIVATMQDPAFAIDKRKVAEYKVYVHSLEQYRK